jgi:tetratricopeptide (TPR) repeat protein
MTADWNEFDTLELRGADPLEKLGDLEPIGEVVSSLRYEKFEHALGLIEPIAQRNPDSGFIAKLYGQALEGVGRDVEATEAFLRVVELSSCDELAYLRLSDLLREALRYTELIETLSAGFSECPQILANANNLAWALATLPDDELRDGERAVAIIEDAISRLEGDDPSYLDTLAVALAEASDFPRAIEVQQKVLGMLRASRAPAPIFALFSSHLEAFEAGKAIRDPAS